MVDGLFDILADDAVAAEEVAALFAHLITEDARLHGKGNLAGTRGLGAVADDASGHAQGVFKGVFDDVEWLTHEVGDATAGGAACADGTTVGREPADARLLVDGNEVRQGHGTNRAFLVDVVFFGVGEDGQADRHALVAAARVDDDGHLASAHAGVATCRSPGTGFDSHVGSETQYGAADVGAPAVLKAFLRDGLVAFDLRLDDRLEVFDVDGVGEIVDVFHAEAAAVGEFGGAALRIARVKQHLVVFLHPYDVGVETRDAHTGGVLLII